MPYKKEGEDNEQGKETRNRRDGNNLFFYSRRESLSPDQDYSDTYNVRRSLREFSTNSFVMYDGTNPNANMEISPCVCSGSTLYDRS